MTIQEFEQRTGFKPSFEYFNAVINPAYMESEALKDEWCKWWKKNDGIQKAHDYEMVLKQYAIGEMERMKKQIEKYQLMLEEKDHTICEFMR